MTAARPLSLASLRAALRESIHDLVIARDPRVEACDEWLRIRWMDALLASIARKDAGHEMAEVRGWLRDGVDAYVAQLNESAVRRLCDELRIETHTRPEDDEMEYIATGADRREEGAHK